MTYEDLKEADKDRICDTNYRNHWCLSRGQLKRITKEHRNAKQSGDEYTCLLIEYRLDHINFHTEAGLLHAGEHEKVLNAPKIR